MLLCSEIQRSTVNHSVGNLKANKQPMECDAQLAFWEEFFTGEISGKIFGGFVPVRFSGGGGAVFHGECLKCAERTVWGGCPEPCAGLHICL